jgi:hypothetical protein
VRASARPLAALLAALAAALPTRTDAAAQFGPGAAIGQFYRVSPPATAGRRFEAVQVDRVAPDALVMPGPVEPVPLGVPLSALTGQILELPERQRVYLAALGTDGRLRLFEIDLITRAARAILPRPGDEFPYAVRFLVAPDASKLYVQWLWPGYAAATDIYDGGTLTWLGRTPEFEPDERAAGFEHRPPYLWTLDRLDRAVLIDTQRDRVVTVFDPRRRFGPAYTAVADAWRDLVLVRSDVGHDRFQLVDVVSGEVGPPLDLEGRRQAAARLVLSGRVLALIDVQRVAPRPGRPRAETAVATGGGALYDLRDGRSLGEFRLVVPPAFPVAAVGTTADPGLPGRLWIHVPGDYQRFDLELPACGRKAPRGDRAAVRVGLGRDASVGRRRYVYTVSVAPESEAVGALAVEAAREAERTDAPDGWGMDRIGRGRWVRWTNGLGPPGEDIAPGTERGGFVVLGRPDTRPAIVEYRAQAAIGLPRGCESDSRFLRNSARGYTVGPERVRTTDPRKLARRLKRLVEQACEIDWIEPGDCEALTRAAARAESAGAERRDAVDRFREALSRAKFREKSAALVLSDAASAVIEALEP